MEQNAWQAYFDDTARSYMAEEYAQPWKEEVDFYLELLDLPPNSRILDIGCGTGRHAVEMARRGYAVTGLDFSSGMLAEAEKAAEMAGVTVEWVQADAARFSVAQLYDAAICMLEAGIGFITPEQDALEHDLAILNNVNAALKPGGRFILGVSNAYQSIRAYKQEDVDNGYFDPVTMTQSYSLIWTTTEGEERQGQVRLRLYTPPELTLLLRQAGFEVEQMWGGTYGRRKIVLDDYMITVVARKV
jgi:SAM-dependent methyltransferase